MRVLVVGGLGNIGHSLCCQLIEEEFDVLALDDITNEQEHKEEKLLQIGRNAFFQFKSIDTDYRNDEEKYDVVVYSLYEPTGNQIYSNLEESLRQTLKHLKDAIEYCHNNGSKFILISSIDVFENKQDHGEKVTQCSPYKDLKKFHTLQERVVLESFTGQEENFSILRLINGDINTRNTIQPRTIYLETATFKIITSLKDVTEIQLNFAEWLRKGWNKEN